MSKKQDCRWTTSFGQTIPSAVLMDIPATCSFSNSPPKSPGQLLHPLRKVLQTFCFPKISRHEAPELNSRRATRRGLKTFICWIVLLPRPCCFPDVYLLTSVFADRENRPYFEMLSEMRMMSDRWLRKGLIKLKVLDSSIRTSGGIVWGEAELSTESPAFRTDSEPLVFFISVARNQTGIVLIAE